MAAKLTGATAERIGAIAGDLAGAEEMFALKDLLARLGAAEPRLPPGRRQARSRLGRASYLFNSTIEGIERADAILLIGANPRLEAAVLNARIRKRWRQGGLAVGVIGEAADLTYPYEYLGAGPQTLEGRRRRQAQLRRPAGRGEAADGHRRGRRGGARRRRWRACRRRRSIALARGGRQGRRLERLQRAAYGGLARRRASTSASCRARRPGCRRHAGRRRRSARRPLPAGRRRDRYGGARQGLRRSIRAATATPARTAPTSMLPGAAYTEKAATYVNLEGRAQMTNRAAFAAGRGQGGLGDPARAVGPRRPHAALRSARGPARGHGKVAPPLGAWTGLVGADWPASTALAARGGPARGRAVRRRRSRDFYLTNPIARASGDHGRAQRLEEAARLEAPRRTHG